MLATAGAAAVLAAIGTPAGAEVDPDASLWALRTRWLAARAAYEAENILPTPEFAAGLAALPPVPWQIPGLDPEASRAAMRARCDALASLEQEHPRQIMSPEAEARQEAAFRTECQVLDEIAATPARTLAGLAFKAEVSRFEANMAPEMVASIMADVAALALAHHGIAA